MSAKNNKCCCTCEPCVTGVTCSNCECVPDCICVTHAIYYDDAAPPTKAWSASTEQRSQLACFDATIGDNGGWEATFPDDGAPCWPSETVTIALIIDGTTCSLEATVNGETKASSVSFDCTTPGGIMGEWRFDTDDPTNPLLAGEILIRIFGYSCGDFPCINTCCVSFPDTLTATVQGYSTDGGPCADSFQVTLERMLSTCSPWYSGTVTDFPWQCDDEGPGLQNLSMTLSPCGDGGDDNPVCRRSAINDTCLCIQCDGTENPGVAGCAWVPTFALSHPTEPDFGTASGTLSKCGWQTGVPWPSGAFISNTCDPVYYEFLMSVAGIADCCDVWHVVVTE